MLARTDFNSVLLLWETVALEKLQGQCYFPLHIIQCATLVYLSFPTETSLHTGSRAKTFRITNASHGVICTVNPQRNPTKLKAYQRNLNNSPVFTKVLL